MLIQPQHSLNNNFTVHAGSTSTATSGPFPATSATKTVAVHLRAAAREANPSPAYRPTPSNTTKQPTRTRGTIVTNQNEDKKLDEVL